MDEFLQNPAVQAGVAPFIAALVVAALLSGTRFLGLAQIAGFLLMAGFAIGFSFESLTATRKLLLLGAASGLAVLALEIPRERSKAAEAVVLVLLATGSIWMSWRLLAQRELQQALAAGGVAALYVAALAGSTLHVSRRDPVAGAAAGLMIGLGSGALAVLGASAVLGMASISVGAGAGAALLVQMIRGRAAPVGASIALPAAVVAGLAGVLATQSGELRWFCLVPVLAAPWAAALVPARLQATWLRAFVAAALALIPMLLAVALAWATAAGSST